MVKETQEETEELILDVLKRDSAKKLYGYKFRLTHVVNRAKTIKTKERIKIYQAQHKNTMEILKSEFK